MKKVLSLLLVLLLLISLAPVQTASAAVKLNKTKITLYEGNTYTLKISGSTKTVKWSTSNKSIATVSTKGKVTAVEAGEVTITATVLSKKYTCKITVKEAFSAKNAITNISADIEDIGSGVVAILKNNYVFPYQLTATVVYYDQKGKMIGKASDDNYYFEVGKECALYFYGPTDGDYNQVSYDSYEITYSVDQLTSSIKSVLSDIETESNIGMDNVMVKVTNSGAYEPGATVVSVVFYKGGVAVGYDYQYAEVSTPESSDFLEFSFPYDNNFDTIQVDDFKVFVNSSYYYTWE
jgi:hypothetical protein